MSRARAARRARVGAGAALASLVGLAAAAGCGDDPRAATEAARRDAYLRGLAAREHLEDAWSLSPRGDLVFADGLGGVTMIDPDAPEPAWPALARPAEVVRGTAARWMGRRAHLRVRGDGARRLQLSGAVNLAVVGTRPRLDVSLDGAPVASVVVGADGGFAVDVVVPAAALDGWADLYLELGSVGEPEKEPPDLRVARLGRVAWEPVAP